MMIVVVTMHVAVVITGYKTDRRPIIYMNECESFGIKKKLLRIWLAYRESPFIFCKRLELSCRLIVQKTVVEVRVHMPSVVIPHFEFRFSFRNNGSQRSTPKR